jgi:hypothetical protein
MRKLKLQKQFVVRGIICAWSHAYQWSCWSLHGGHRTDRFIVLNCWCMPASCWVPAQALRLAQLQLHVTLHGLERLIVAAKLVRSTSLVRTIRLASTSGSQRLDDDVGCWQGITGADELRAMCCACAVVFFCDHMDRGVAWGKWTDKNLVRPLADCVLWLAGHRVCRAPTGIPCRSTNAADFLLFLFLYIPF